MNQVIITNGFIYDEIYKDTNRILEIAVDDDPRKLVDQFLFIDMIIIPFASSSDGRGFSLAAQLRHLGYKGCLRAKGHILVDQFRAALRSGFDQVEITDEQAQRNPEWQWKAVLHDKGYKSRIFIGQK